jgi:hypothetical protein
MTRRLLWVTALAGLLWAGRPAAAQTINYEFANSSGVAQTTFTVAVGSTVPILVYLHEPTANAPTLNSNNGLATAAVRVTYNTPAGIADVQSAAQIVTAVPPWQTGNNFLGNGMPASNPVNTAVMSNLTFGSGGVGVLPDSAGRILLGTFTVRGLAGGSVSLSAQDPNPGTTGDVTSFNPTVNYDAFLHSATATLTVTPVPEPGSLALVGVAAAAGLAWRRRAAAVRA